MHDETRDSQRPTSEERDDAIRDARAAVARRLRHLRAHHPEGPFTLAALAERSGVSQRTLAQVESAEGSNVTLETLVKVAHSLGVARPGYFLDEEVFRQVNAELTALKEMRDQQLQGVAMRTSTHRDWSPSAVQEISLLITDILDNAAKVKGALQGMPNEQVSEDESGR
ncbi:helix-turn-helix domain-containing protein [Streptomyces sp. NPDC014733]|uniref:helix-turn-helix domain-containing protein n=1 Tax=Streptomyces sp. NPDC014733 TaxID=3364885 RepID=UPI0036FA2929